MNGRGDLERLIVGILSHDGGEAFARRLSESVRREMGMIASLIASGALAELPREARRSYAGAMRIYCRSLPCGFTLAVGAAAIKALERELDPETYRLARQVYVRRNYH